MAVRDRKVRPSVVANIARRRAHIFIHAYTRAHCEATTRHRHRRAVREREREKKYILRRREMSMDSTGCAIHVCKHISAFTQYERFRSIFTG